MPYCIVSKEGLTYGQSLLIKRSRLCKDDRLQGTGSILTKFYLVLEIFLTFLCHPDTLLPIRAPLFSCPNVRKRVR
jgi:hypothetical protein